MALTKNPKLALIPSGYKASKVYSVLPSDGVGDFDFERDTIATRVNKQGLIETVDTNTPRLNYPLIDGVVSGCPSLLLENSATNLIPYSEDIATYWGSGPSIITSNQGISPNGTLNADLVSSVSVNANVSATHTVLNNSLITTQSIFVKYISGTSNFMLRGAFVGGTATAKASKFNLATGSVISTDTTASIEYYGNGWYRVSQQIANNSSGNTTLVFQNFTTNDTISTNEILLWGAQSEVGSFPTSYIPSLTGSQTTRSVETCNNAGDVNTFNDSEGVLFGEISALNNTVDGYKTINIGSNSADNRLGFGFDDQSRIYGFKRTNTSWNIPIEANINEFNKVAISYDTNNNHFWLNGFKVGSNTTIGDITQPIELDFRASYGGEQFNGSTKQIQYFDTALTDTDLEELTSWTSFNEMANAQLYTIL